MPLASGAAARNATSNRQNRSSSQGNASFKRASVTSATSSTGSERSGSSRTVSPRPNYSWRSRCLDPVPYSSGLARQKAGSSVATFRPALTKAREPPLQTRERSRQKLEKLQGPKLSEPASPPKSGTAVLVDAATSPIDVAALAPEINLRAVDHRLDAPYCGRLLERDLNLQSGRWPLLERTLDQELLAAENDNPLRSNTNTNSSTILSDSKKGSLASKLASPPDNKRNNTNNSSTNSHSENDDPNSRNFNFNMSPLTRHPRRSMSVTLPTATTTTTTSSIFDEGELQHQAPVQMFAAGRCLEPCLIADEKENIMVDHTERQSNVAKMRAIWEARTSADTSAAPRRRSCGAAPLHSRFSDAAESESWCSPNRHRGRFSSVGRTETKRIYHSLKEAAADLRGAVRTAGMLTSPGGCSSSSSEGAFLESPPQIDDLGESVHYQHAACRTMMRTIKVMKAVVLSERFTVDAKAVGPKEKGEEEEEGGVEEADVVLTDDIKKELPSPRSSDAMFSYSGRGSSQRQPEEEISDCDQVFTETEHSLRRSQRSSLPDPEREPLPLNSPSGGRRSSLRSVLEEDQMSGVVKDDTMVDTSKSGICLDLQQQEEATEATERERGQDQQHHQHQKQEGGAEENDLEDKEQDNEEEKTIKMHKCEPEVSPLLAPRAHYEASGHRFSASRRLSGMSAGVQEDCEHTFGSCGLSPVPGCTDPHGHPDNSPGIIHVDHGDSDAGSVDLDGNLGDFEAEAMDGEDGEDEQKKHEADVDVKLALALTGGTLQGAAAAAAGEDNVDFDDYDDAIAMQECSEHGAFIVAQPFNNVDMESTSIYPTPTPTPRRGHSEDETQACEKQKKEVDEDEGAVAKLNKHQSNDHITENAATDADGKEAEVEDHDEGEAFSDEEGSCTGSSSSSSSSSPRSPQYIKAGQAGMPRQATFLQMFEEHELRRQVNIIVPEGLGENRVVSFVFENVQMRVTLPEGSQIGQEVPVVIPRRPPLEQNAHQAACRGHAGFPDRVSISEPLRHCSRAPNTCKLSDVEFTNRYEMYKHLRGRSMRPLLPYTPEEDGCITEHSDQEETNEEQLCEEFSVS